MSPVRMGFVLVFATQQIAIIGYHRKGIARSFLYCVATKLSTDDNTVILPYLVNGVQASFHATDGISTDERSQFV